MNHRPRRRAVPAVLFVLIVLFAPPATAQETDLSGGDDPGAAQGWFLVRRLPAVKASGAPSLAGR
ncbi:MAG TPA: hypothetical protein VLX28_22580, partial [Thermoanaerobaculia bacterium]|nr:hypothetical protein [Thermoanaerobaculia bacterium]